MSIRKAIDELLEERRRIDAVIADLEAMCRNGGPLLPEKPRRGRKSMNAEERQEVSERMRNYWADKRKQP